nr:hypothetical protein [Tanacetum cinerariifolium]
MQKRRNDVKGRTTLLLALPDEHQLRFSKYKTAQELWAAILKTFSGNEATKKTKKNLLKQQYGNFKAEGVVDGVGAGDWFFLSKSNALTMSLSSATSAEMAEFGESYEAPQQESTTTSASEGSVKKKGRTVALTTDDMQKRRNDVKGRTTLLLALLDEHQLRFSKYKTAQELWAAILKTFSGNEATKKTKKNLLKQHGNEEFNTTSIPTASTQVSPAGPNVTTASISLDTV